MFEIAHDVSIACSPDRLFAAITSEKIISEWWLKGSRYEAHVGSRGHFPFRDGRGEIVMEVIELVSPMRQLWKCLEHKNSDWIGTFVSFEVVAQPDASSLLKFRHSGWQENTGVFAQVSFFWAAAYLRNLKLLLEAENSLTK